MNRQAIVPVLALLIAGTASAAVDPALLNLAMPDAKVLYGIQVQATLASPFGQFAVSHLPAAITRFAAATGFDVARDLQEVLVASAHPGDESDVLILARGTFPWDKLVAVAKTTGATVYDYHGVSVITPPERDAKVLAFLDASTLVVGSETVVRDVIDRHAASAVFAGPLLQKSQQASVNAQAWFATISPLIDMVPAPSNSSSAFDPAVLLESVIETWAGLHFDNFGVTVFAEALTHSDAEAQGLATLLKLAAGMVRGTPAAALQNAQVTARGPVMRITLSVAERDLERSFPSAALERAAR